MRRAYGVGEGGVELGHVGAEEGGQLGEPVGVSADELVLQQLGGVDSLAARRLSEPTAGRGRLLLSLASDSRLLGGCGRTRSQVTGALETRPGLTLVQCRYRAWRLCASPGVGELHIAHEFAGRLGVE